MTTSQQSAPAGRVTVAVRWDHGVLSVSDEPSGEPLVDLEAAVLHAVTAYPNEVVLDLSRVRDAAPVMQVLGAALRSLADWPHPPVFVVPPVADPAAVAALAAERVDVVSTVAVATATVTARPWTPSERVTLDAPLLAPEVGRTRVLQFLHPQMHLRRRTDAALLVADALLSWAAGGGADQAELRLAGDATTLGIAVAWTGTGPAPFAEPDLDVVVAVADGLAVLHAPDGHLARAVLRAVLRAPTRPLPAATSE